ncbi:carboxypeptidase regulatory-like domain-containing protein [Granulicella sp. S190]|uniref:carboxypeptidase regulatory-like domain-containing protein n=1 Tax=Granulicella sp. S190 TaxID=1747226 RepID=UPI00131D6E05|nr:carboxypeptidase regulatory-like domain-containing protein [Granulicella sp. S190]
MRRISLFVPAITMAFIGAALGQTTSGDLVGTVKDPSGAIIANATIVVTNVDTGVATTEKAGTSGEFRVGNLLPGKYDLVVSSSGFQPFTLRGIVIELNKTSTTNVALSIGASTTVEVAAEAGAVLDTTSTNLTQTFSNVELTDLPSTSSGGSNGFGVLNASLLSPGVASSGGIGIGVGPSIGGQRPRNNNFTIEGVDNNNKAVTGPLIYLPNDSVESFTLITNQFSPEFGHSSGGQFNTNVLSGTNKFHGRLYEYFQNRNLNAEVGTQGGKPAINPRYDNNRYGGQVGGPILRDKLFFFVNFERNSIGNNPAIFSCVPTAAGLSTLKALGAPYGLNANNLAQYLKYTQPATITGAGGAGIDASADVACGSEATGAQFLTVNSATSGASTNIPLGNYQSTAGTPSNFDVLTTSVDYTITNKDSFRGRYIYNRLSDTDTAGNTIPFPVFFTQQPFRYQLVALSEFHTFTPNLTNEFRIGFNRYSNTLTAGNFSYPGLDQFPNLVFVDQGNINLGPDPNAPQFTIQNLYQVVDNVSYVKGKHTIKIGFDGRKYISPQGFTQRARGDYEWNNLSEFLQDLAPTSFGERSTGSLTYYGDQTALYGYVNDTWRASPKLTLNGGLRYEFTSVPVGERAQGLNSAASVPGLISFTEPKPAYKSFAPRIGINYAPDDKTSVRAGFGLSYDVLFDNLGTLSFPPQYSATNDVGNVGNPQPGDPNFLANGGLPPGNGGILVFPNTPAGLADQRGATAAYIPNQTVPYAETYTLTIQRTFLSKYTGEIGYVGTRGIHLPTQDQINIQPRVNATNQLPTSLSGGSAVISPVNANTLGAIQALSNIRPDFLAQGFTSKITSYQPYSSSNYNALVANVTRQYVGGFQTNLSYTYSKTMDDATAEVFATTLTPRRPQNSQNVAADYSRSALDRTHRISLEAVYDLQLYKHSSSFLLRNVVGNWTIAPIYTYESPEYATVLSGVNSNQNGDSGSAIDRTIINPTGVKGTSSLVSPQYATNLASLCTADTETAPGQCPANLVGYVANDPTAYYIQAGAGTLPNASRNSLATRPINNFDMSALKRVTFHERYSFEFGAQAYNVLNHAQYTPGTVNNINTTSNTTTYLNFQTVGNGFFNQPGKVFTNNARSMQLSGKLFF